MARFLLTAQLRLAGPANVKQIVNQINNQLKGINAVVNINVNQQQLNTLNKNLKATSKSAQTATSDMEKFGEQAALAIRRYGAFTLATGGFIKLSQAISSGIDEAIKFDREMIRVSQVTGQSLKSLSGLSKEITRLSTTFGVSSTEILKASVTLSQAGLATKDVKTALEALAKTGVSATFGTIENTTEAAIAIFQQFKIEAKDLESTLSSVNKVSAAFAVESDDISVAVRRSGGAFKAAGGNLNEFIALFTSVRQTTRESAESIATGFRTIFTRLQRLSTQNFFKQFGVELQDLEGKFVGPYEAIRRISQALKDIDSNDPRFSQVVEELGGFRQVSKVVPLLTEFATAEKALNIALRGGNSLTEDAAIAQDALAVKIQKVKEEFQDLIRTLSNNAAFRGIIDVTLELARSLISLTKSLEPVLPLLTAVAGVGIGNSLGQFSKGFKKKIFGFSKGGLVPGVGDTDSVPAMLTPGEYVLTKQATKNLGIQKFAEGGKVLTNKQLMQALGFTNNTQLTNAKREFGAEELQSKAQSAINSGSAGVFFTKKQEKQQQLFDDSSLRPIYLDASKFAMVRPEARPNPSYTHIENAASTIIRARGGDKVRDAFIETLGLNKKELTANQIKEELSRTQVIGDIPTISFNPSVSKTFDGRIEKVFSDSIEKFVNEFLGPDNILKPKEQPNLATILSKSAINSIRGSFFEGIVKRASSDFRQGDKDEVFDFLSPGETNKNLDKFLNAPLIFPSDAKAGDLNSDKLSVAAKGIKTFGAKVLKFASGGHVPGSGSGDTVPALLTPGEYVVNKSAAQAIGYHNLGKINKYAKGGIVGNIANNLTSNPVGMIALFTGLQGFVETLSGTNKELNSLTSTISSVVTRFVVLNTIISSIQKSQTLSSVNLGQFSSRGFASNDRIKQFFGATPQQFSAFNSALSPDQRRINGLAGFKAKKLFSNLSAVGVGLGAGLGIGGDFLSNQSNLELEQGKDSRTKSNIGAALTGAGTGAAVGAIFGPWGAAIGAVTGGLVGLASNITTANKAFETGKFNKKLEELSGILGQFSKERISARNISSNISDSLKEGLARFSTGDATTRQDTSAFFKQNADVIEKYFNDIAASSDSMEDFNKATKDSLLNFAVLTKIPFKSLEEQIKKNIGALNKQNDSLKLATKLRELEVQNIRNLISLSNAFESASQDIGKFDRIIENMVNLANGNAFSGDNNSGSEIFKKAAKGEVFGAGLNKIEEQASVVANLGGLGNGIVEEVKQTADLLGRLPEFIQQFNAEAKVKGFDREQSPEALARIVKEAGITNPEVLNKLQESIKNDILGTAQSEGKLNTEFENPLQVAEKLRPKLNELINIFGNSVDVLEQQERSLKKVSEARLQTEQKIIDVQLNNITRLQDFKDRIGELRNQPLLFNEAKERLGNNAGFVVGGNALRGNLGRRLQDAQTRAAELQTRIQNTVAGRERNELNKSLVKEQSEINKLNKAIGILTNDTSVLAAGFRELDEEAKKNQFKRGLVETLTFGNAQQKAGLSQDIINTVRTIAAGNNINAVNSEQRGGVLDFLRGAGKTKIGGTPANEILKQIVNNDLQQQALLAFNFDKKKVNSPEVQSEIKDLVAAFTDGGLTQRQEQLIEQMQKFISDQTALSDASNKALMDLPNNLQNALEASNNQFGARIEKIFLEAEERRLTNELNKNKSEKADINTAQSAFANLKELIAPNDDNIDIKDLITSAKNRISTIDSAINDRNRVDELKQAQKDIVGRFKEISDNLESKPKDIIDPNSATLSHKPENIKQFNLDKLELIEKSISKFPELANVIEQLKKAETPNQFNTILNERIGTIQRNRFAGRNAGIDEKTGRAEIVKIEKMIESLKGFESFDKLEKKLVDTITSEDLLRQSIDRNTAALKNNKTETDVKGNKGQDTGEKVKFKVSNILDTILPSIKMNNDFTPIATNKKDAAKARRLLKKRKKVSGPFAGFDNEEDKPADASRPVGFGINMSDEQREALGIRPRNNIKGKSPDELAELGIGRKRIFDVFAGPEGRIVSKDEGDKDRKRRMDAIRAAKEARDSEINPETGVSKEVERNRRKFFGARKLDKINGRLQPVSALADTVKVSPQPAFRSLSEAGQAAMDALEQRDDFQALEFDKQAARRAKEFEFQKNTDRQNARMKQAERNMLDRQKASRRTGNGPGVIKDSDINQVIPRLEPNRDTRNSYNFGFGVSSNQQTPKSIEIAGLDKFQQIVSELSSVTSKLSGVDISMTGTHDLNVTLNGATALSEMQPELVSLVKSKIKDAFNEFERLNDIPGLKNPTRLMS